MDSTFERLLGLAPPPTAPVDAGSPERWGEIEHAVGTGLPDDYKRFINAYGSGEFCDLLWLLNPFSTGEGMNLLHRLGPISDHYRMGRDKYFPERCPYPIFPEPGGLLPLGGDTNGNNIFWITTGPPDRWSVVLYDWRGGYDSERHEMPLVEFLVGWLSGEIPGCFFGVGINSPIIKKDPVFCPSGTIRESQKLGRDGKPPFGSEDGCWFTYVFHLQSLRCGRCGVTQDFSREFGLNGGQIDQVATADVGRWVEESTSRAVIRAKEDGWRIVDYPSDPKFLCPSCGGRSGAPIDIGTRPDDPR